MQIWMWFLEFKNEAGILGPGDDSLCDLITD